MKGCIRFWGRLDHSGELSLPFGLLVLNYRVTTANFLGARIFMVHVLGYDPQLYGWGMGGTDTCTWI